MFKNNKGFTLIEMLIVLMIISVLIILIIPNLSNRSEDLHETGCDALVSVVESQVALFHLDKGSYPTNLDSLASDGYITDDQKTCPNGIELGYDSANGSVSEPS